MKSINVILSISVSIPVWANDEATAMNIVSKAVSEGNANMIAKISEATDYSIHHSDCIEVTDAVEVD